jgi:hypothetical protein
MWSQEVYTPARVRTAPNASPGPIPASRAPSRLARLARRAYV